MLKCKDCEHWEQRDESWYGNCKTHPFWRDQASQDCTPIFNKECKGKDFLDKYEKYKTPEWKAKGVTVL